MTISPVILIYREIFKYKINITLSKIIKKVSSPSGTRRIFNEW